MTRKVSEKIVDKQIRCGSLSAKDRNVYIYGYQTMIEMAIIIAVALIVAVLSDSLFSVIGFCVAFIPLRIYSGGWHAKNIFICAIVSGLVIYGSIVLRQYLELIDVRIGLLIEIIVCIMIIVLSPVETKEKKLNRVELRRYKKYVIIILTAELILSILDVVIYSGELHILIFYTIVVQILNLLFIKFINCFKKPYASD